MSALLLALGIVAAAGGPPQSLAGIAAEAEAARRGRPPAPVVGDDALTAKGPLPLTVPLVRHYSAIRTELTTLRVARPDLDRRLYDRSRSVGGLFELVPVLEAEPEVRAVLTRHRTTAREYLRMDQAVLTATHYSVSHLPEPLRLHAQHWQNVVFVYNHPALLREEGRQWGTQWHDTIRFVEQF
jgi:hypothetical protein